MAASRLADGPAREIAGGVATVPVRQIVAALPGAHFSAELAIFIPPVWPFGLHQRSFLAFDLRRSPVVLCVSSSLLLPHGGMGHDQPGPFDHSRC